VSGKVLQGWQSDPFGVHEARYFSADGQPTKLVRDRGAESYDEPPSGADEVAAAMARMSALPPPPSVYPPRDAYQYGRVSEPDPRGRLSIVGLAASGIIIVAAVVAVVLIALTLLKAPKHGSTPGANAAAFVTQAATGVHQWQVTEEGANLGQCAELNPAQCLEHLTLELFGGRVAHGRIVVMQGLVS
jgi:hypothetical protein